MMGNVTKAIVRGSAQDWLLVAASGPVGCSVMLGNPLLVLVAARSWRPVVLPEHLLVGFVRLAQLPSVRPLDSLASAVEVSELLPHRSLDLLP